MAQFELEMHKFQNVARQLPVELSNHISREAMHNASAR